MNGLTPKQQKAVVLVASGMQGVEISKKVSISQQTLCEWKNTPEFNFALNTLRENALKEAEQALASLSVEAVNVLREILREADNESVRLKAAIYLIDKLELQGVFINSSKGSKSVNMPQLLAALGVN